MDYPFQHTYVAGMAFIAGMHQRKGHYGKMFRKTHDLSSCSISFHVTTNLNKAKIHHHKYILSIMSDHVFGFEYDVTKKLLPQN